MTRPTNWLPLEYSTDPVPGYPAGVRQAGSHYVATADAISRAAQNLLTIAADDFGLSEAVDAVRGQAEEIAGRVARAEERYRGVGNALITYADALEGAQDTSATALTQAEGHREAMNTALSQENYWNGLVVDHTTPPANLPQYEQNARAAVERGNTARGLWQEARTMAEGAVTARNSAAEVAVAAIELVESSGDLNDGFWDNVSQWINEHQDLLDLIGTILEIVATVVLVVALLIPGVNVLATIALVAITANLVYQSVNAIAQVATGNMSWGEAILNVGFALLNFVGIGVVARAAVRSGTSAGAAALRTLPAATRGGARRSTQAIIRHTGDDVLAPATRPLWDGLGLLPSRLSTLMPRLAAPRLAGLEVMARMIGPGGTPLAPEMASVLRRLYLGAGAVNVGTSVGESLASPYADALPQPFPTWRVYGDGVVPSFGRW